MVLVLDIIATMLYYIANQSQGKDASKITDQANIIFTDRGQMSSCVFLACNASATEVYAYLAEMDRRGYHCSTDLLSTASLFSLVVSDFLNSPEFTGKGVTLIPVPNRITVETLHEINTDPAGNGYFLVKRSPQRSVRRFRLGIEYSESIPEMQKNEVVAEYAEAIRHPYYHHIGEIFKAMKGIALWNFPVTPKWSMETALKKQEHAKAKQEYRSIVKTIDAQEWF